MQKYVDWYLMIFTVAQQMNPNGTVPQLCKRHAVTQYVQGSFNGVLTFTTDGVFHQSQFVWGALQVMAFCQQLSHI